MRKSQVSRKVAQTLYNLGIATLAASVVWVGIGVYNAAIKRPEVDVKKEDLEPINANLNMEFLEEIAQREQLTRNVDSYLERELGNQEVVEEEEEVESSEITETPVPDEESTPSSEASPAGELEQ